MRKGFWQFWLTLGLTMTLVLLAALPGWNQPLSEDAGPRVVEPISPQSTISQPTIDRQAFEQLFLQTSPREAVSLLEELKAVEYQQQLGIDLYGEVPDAQEVGDRLSQVAKKTGSNPVAIFVTSLEESLDLLAVFPTPPPSAAAPFQVAMATDSNPVLTPSAPRVLRQQVPEANRAAVTPVLKQLRELITDSNSTPEQYLVPAQQLYQWILAPLEPALQQNRIDTLVFVMDVGFRSIPLSVLYDGKQFAIEKYRVAIVPSFGLTDLRDRNLGDWRVLAMGADRFQSQLPLPAVPVELSLIAQTIPQTAAFLNQQFTLDTLKTESQRQRTDIIHLATHAEFQPGRLANSYIQLWDTRLTLKQLEQLARDAQWNHPAARPIELLVLSACRTALGDPQSELGFTGLAIASGIKSAIGSLWYVSDVGTLAAMSEFYHNLNRQMSKSEALRQAQLAVLKGQVQIQSEQLILSNQQVIPLPPEVAILGDIPLTHPYYWSAFTLVGNWL